MYRIKSYGQNPRKPLFKIGEAETPYEVSDKVLIKIPGLISGYKFELSARVEFAGNRTSYWSTAALVEISKYFSMYTFLLFFLFV